MPAVPLAHRSHRCAHDALPKATRPLVVPQSSAPRRRLQQGTTLPGLRVTFETTTLSGDSHACTSIGERVLIGEASSDSAQCGGSVTNDCEFVCAAEHILTPQKRAALARLLPAAAAWLSAALRTLSPVSGPLAVSSEVPCGFGGAVNIPPRLLADGSPETDVLILVSARPTAGSALAFAGHCQEDGGSANGQYVPRRPTVGHMNIDPAAIDTSAIGDAGVNEDGGDGGDGGEGGGGEGGADVEAAVDSLLKVLLHETLHVLGFTHDKLVQLPCPTAPGFDRYIGGGGRRLQSSTSSDSALSSSDPAAHGLRDCALAGSIEPIVERAVDGGRPRRFLATPRVVSAARRHFNCTLDVTDPTGGGGL